jgi:PPM family protein phosphatase
MFRHGTPGLVCVTGFAVAGWLSIRTAQYNPAVAKAMIAQRFVVRDMFLQLLPKMRPAERMWCCSISERDNCAFMKPMPSRGGPVTARPAQLAVTTWEYLERGRRRVQWFHRRCDRVDANGGSTAGGRDHELEDVPMREATTPLAVADAGRRPIRGLNPPVTPPPPSRRFSSAGTPKSSGAGPRTLERTGIPRFEGVARAAVSQAFRIGLEFDDRSFLVARGRGLIGREPTPPAGQRTTHLVTLTDPTCSLSRTHLEFGIGDSGLWVRDRHSTNGSEVEVDGQRRPLEPGRAVPVRPASTIHLGRRRIRVRTVDCRAVTDTVTVEWGAATRAGAGRERNQDTFGAHAPVFVVADGIGSHGAGDLASREAVQALLGLAGSQPVTDETINSAFADARSRIAQIPASDRRRSPGTTVSGVIVTRCDGVPCWTVVNLGDSRTYRLNAAGLRQLTVDHSIAQKLIDAGVTAGSGPEPLPLRNILSRALVGGVVHSPDVWRLPIDVGDRILVCSDGVSSAVDDPTIQRVLQAVRDPQAAAEALVESATRAGGRDDVTAVVVDAAAIQPWR